jgi:hypothetical protein
MLSLPVELRLQTIRHIRDSIPSPLFEDDARGSIRAIEVLYQILVALSLCHREWTTIAQSELFRNLYIQDAEKMKLLLSLLHGSREARGYIKHSRSAVLGGKSDRWRHSRGLGDDLDKFADYCPDLAEMSCFNMEIQVVEFRTSCCHTLQSFRMLISLSQSDLKN